MYPANAVFIEKKYRRMADAELGEMSSIRSGKKVGREEDDSRSEDDDRL